MATVTFGERIARAGRLSVGAAAVIFDPARAKVLLTRRADNGLWCLPGGRMEPGESAAEACEREVREETGLIVQVRRLIGAYTSPHVLVEYADGNKWHVVAFSFECDVIGGAPGLSDETTEIGWFTREQVHAMPMLPHHVIRIDDAFEGRPEAFAR